MSLNADTNRVGLSYVEEDTTGVVPTNPIFKTFRYTGSSDLKYDYKTATSTEIVPSRQISDQYSTGAKSSGGVNFELSLDSYDDLIEGTMFNRWQRNIVRNDTQATLLFADIEFVTSTTGKINFDSSVTTAPFLTNSIVYIDGVGDQFSGAIVEITGGTFSSPDFFHDFTVLNGKTVENITATSESRVYRCGYIFQDVLQAASSPNTLTSTTTDMTTLGFTVGQWIKIGSDSNSAVDGFDTVADNDFVRIESIATNVLTLDKVPTSWAADTNAGSKNIAIFYDTYIQNGTTEISYTLERSYLDHIPVNYEYFKGMRVDEMQISNETQSVTTGTFSFMGLSTTYTTAREAGAVTVDAFSTTPFNTVNNINYLELNDIDISGGANTSGINLALKVDFSFKNNLRGQNAIGSLPYVGVGVGQFDASGTVETYFQDNSILTLLANNTDTSLRVRYNIGSRYQVIDCPRVKITTGAPDVSGVNADVTAEYGFQALEDTSVGYTASMSKVSTY